MRRAAMSIVLAAALGAAAVPAAGQGAAEHFLAADASKTGVVTLVFFGPADGTVRFHERVGNGRVLLGQRSVGPLGAAILPDATTWLCERPVRRFEATETTTYGKQLQASFEVRTPSCRDRLDISVPRRVRRGGLLSVRLRDTWRLGGVEPRVCVAAPRARLACRSLPIVRGTASASRSFRAKRSGRWRVEIRFGPYKLRRTVAVGPSAPAATSQPVYLTTGDSTIQGIDAFLADELGNRATVRSQYFVGTGISSTITPWPGLPAKQRRTFSPAATVISIGANEGATMNGAECCGEAWIAEYARRAAAMMRTYRRVVWLTLPAPRDARRRPTTAAVNAAVVRAAATHSGTRLVRLDEVFTPGGVYAEEIRHRGQTIRVRQPDGIHLTLPALSIAAALVADTLTARSER